MARSFIYYILSLLRCWCLHGCVYSVVCVHITPLTLTQQAGGNRGRVRTPAIHSPMNRLASVLANNLRTWAHAAVRSCEADQRAHDNNNHYITPYNVIGSHTQTHMHTLHSARAPAG